MAMLRGMRVDRHAADRIDRRPGRSLLVMMMCSLGHGPLA
jgi:hypothetical protein